MEEENQETISWPSPPDSGKVKWTNPPRLRVAKLRIGIVLSNEGGALQEMIKPIMGPCYRWQRPTVLSWIHLDDLCKMFMTAVENEG